MSDHGFEIKGLEKLIDMTEEIQKNFSTDLDKLIKRHGGVLLGNVKRRTPVDTGQLRRSWDIEKKYLYVRIFTSTEYAAFIEYGHRARNGKSYVEGVFMLKIAFEKQIIKLEEDLEKLMKEYGFE